MARLVPPARKSIFDPIHGNISVRGSALTLIGLPEFQRLWGIRQTGFAHLVFPGANHTRLEHSLGVYSVAHSMAEALGLSDLDREAVAIGGLLHDLGHGPFSHTLEPTMREVLGHGHETISREWIVGERSRPEEERVALPTVPEVIEAAGLSPKALANLVDPPARPAGPPLLRSVLHGAIDADRIDYLQRDAHYTGVAHGAIDAVRLLETVQQHRGRLVFAEKGRNAVEGLLVGRALMYSSVYYHKTVRSAEVMAQAAVERHPAFPEGVRPLFGATDAELLADLGRAPGAPGRLMRALRGRQLLRRGPGWRTLDATGRRYFRRLVDDPRARRSEEDRLAERVGASPGSVLFDLAGLEGRTSPGSDWSEVGIVEEGRVTHPFRAPSVWQALAIRPPTRYLVSLYCERTAATTLERRAAAGSLDLPTVPPTPRARG